VTPARSIQADTGSATPATLFFVFRRFVHVEAAENAGQPTVA
jgi:hypothetical protein